MNKQTAVQWFQSRISILIPEDIGSQLMFKSNLKKALEMEREQITDAYSTYAFDEHGMRIHASQYYDETYGGQDER